MDADERRRARAGWPIRRFALGAEPAPDYSHLDVSERVALAARLSLEMWLQSGRALPSYSRDEMPGKVIRPSAAKKKPSTTET